VTTSIKLSADRTKNKNYGSITCWIPLGERLLNDHDQGFLHIEMEVP
jgi:hypothetical protein